MRICHVEISNFRGIQSGSVAFSRHGVLFGQQRREIFDRRSLAILDPFVRCRSPVSKNLNQQIRNFLISIDAFSPLFRFRLLGFPVHKRLANAKPARLRTTRTTNRRICGFVSKVRPHARGMVELAASASGLSHGLLLKRVLTIRLRRSFATVKSMPQVRPRTPE